MISLTIVIAAIWASAASCVASEVPLEIVEYPNIDACSSYLPERATKEDFSALMGIQVVALDSSKSLNECSKLASSWHDSDQPDLRCRTACWFRNPQNKTLINQCFCLTDPIWMPKHTKKEHIDSARLNWACRDDSDCSFNGHCHATGRCYCSKAWKGIMCGELDLLPVDRSRLGFRQVDVNGNISSWGAPVLWDEASRKWHGYASEIQDGCGINAWETNSRIVHIVGNSPHGPYLKIDVVFPAFAHEASVVRGPHGEWVMLFSSFRYNASGLAAVICCNCKGGVTPEISPKCPFQLGKPDNLRHRFRQMLSIAQSPSGPWSSPIEIPQLSAGWDWNTALTINDDGSAVALIRGGSTWHATNYSDPTTWRPVGSTRGKGSQGPGWAGVSVEDPFIWQEDGVYHALAHAFLPFYGVHAFAPIPRPEFNWSLPLNWTVTGVAFDNIVKFSDGTSHSYARRERPHLVWAPSGAAKEGDMAVSLSNGVQYAGRLRQAYADGVFTLIQPLGSDYLALEKPNFDQR
jgi:hypothetical protein